MAAEYTIISIGTLSHNRLWGEATSVRTSHATTTLVADEGRLILVDPSLPAAALSARFFERTGKQLSAVTDVFCTTLRPVHRRALEAIGQARWWAGEAELEAYRGHLAGLLDSAKRMASDDAGAIESEMKLMDRFAGAPDKFGEQVSLYPLAGPSAGSCGLLLTPATSTILIAGDAALTGEHVLRGQVWEGCLDAEAAMESLRDIVEVADVIVPGHDNMLLTPAHWR
jgi:glyoxylase-like metal-dependent hydrolase (beta-lactamase superfamily II)